MIMRTCQTCNKSLEQNDDNFRTYRVKGVEYWATHCRDCISIREICYRRGISVEEYHAMDQACGICGRDDVKMYLDHDHKTNSVRGMLCQQCNTMLGMACDDPTVLRKAADYVEKHNARNTD